MAIAKTDDGCYLVLRSDLREAPAASQTRAPYSEQQPEPIETPLALRTLAVFHSELERPRTRRPPGLFVDMDTMVWIESHPGLPVLSGERIDCVGRDTRLGRMFELVSELCAYRDCYPDERVKALNQIDQIVTEIEVALKFEALPSK